MSSIPTPGPSSQAIISGRTSLLNFIEEQKRVQGLSDAEVCRRAGMGQNVLGNLRCYPDRSTTTKTLIALVNAMGYELVAVPERAQ